MFVTHSTYSIHGVYKPTNITWSIFGSPQTIAIICCVFHYLFFIYSKKTIKQLKDYTLYPLGLGMRGASWTSSPPARPRGHSRSHTPLLDIFRSGGGLLGSRGVCTHELVGLERDSPFLDDHNPQYMKGSIIP